MKRRTLVVSGLAGAGALLVGWAASPRSRLGRGASLPVSDDDVALNGWIKITGDGSVLLAMPYSEMGQGAHTGVAMLVAEELDLPLTQVHPVSAGHDTLYGNVSAFVAQQLWFHPHDHGALQQVSEWAAHKLGRELGVRITGGSSTLRDAWEPVRVAAATARGQLLGAAALRWRLPVDELSIAQGIVSHASGPRAHFGELARQAAATRPASTQPKPAASWTLLGQRLPRSDVPAKTDGRARFGIDVRLPGMVYAALRFAPALGGSPAAVDPSQALSLPGVLRVVRVPAMAGADAAVAVVGTTWWHAKRGLDALNVRWNARPAGALDSQAVAASLEQAARDAALSGEGFAFHTRGDAPHALRDAARTVEAVYRVPYLAHAPMEPMNCTARVAQGRVDVWASTQVPGLARAMAAQVAGVAPDAVTVHETYLGGGFGRRLEVDVVGQAVRIALETGGAPVQLIWPREEDFTHDFYRPAAVAVMRAALDTADRVQALAVTSAGPAIAAHYLKRVGYPLADAMGRMPDRSTSEGLFDQPYGIAHQHITHVSVDHGVPVGHGRGGGHAHNAFFTESFIDELAHATRQDPVAFRLALLRESPRHAAVLQLAAAKAGWSRVLPAGRARGVALHECFGSIVAQVAEVSLDADQPRVHRVVCAIDCGVAVNPALVAQQMESGIVFGLTAALHGRIDIRGGVVQQKNFPDQPLLTLAHTPRIETHIVSSREAPGGVSGAGVSPIAPAVANALFVLTGRRWRSLPLMG